VNFQAINGIHVLGIGQFFLEKGGSLLDRGFISGMAKIEDLKRMSTPVRMRELCLRFELLYL
jgi:hypothetical protein